MATTSPVGKVLSKLYASKTETELLALAETEPAAVGFSSDEESIVFNGKAIRGVSEWGRDYLLKQYEEECLSKLTCELAFSPSNGSELTGKPTLTVTATVKYDGTLVDPTSIGKATTGAPHLTKQSTGVYQGSAEVPSSSTNGKLSFTVTYNVVYNGLTKQFRNTFVQYAPIYIGSSAATSVPESSVSSFTNKYVKSSCAGEYSLTITSGQYVYICIPSFMSLTKVTSSGFDVPLEAAETFTVILSDDSTVSYKAYRTSSKPQSSPMNIEIA